MDVVEVNVGLLCRGAVLVHDRTEDVASLRAAHLSYHAIPYRYDLSARDIKAIPVTLVYAVIQYAVYVRVFVPR